MAVADDDLDEGQEDGGGYQPSAATGLNRVVKILIYVALDDRTFAIIGDQGIHAKVGENFWEHEKDEMTSYFANNDIIGGIVYFIEKAGEKLKEFFPYQSDDVNELSDDISTGE